MNGALREGELVVNLPVPMRREIDLYASSLAIECNHGCLAVEMDPPREQQGSILIPETVGARLRADCGTVVAENGTDLGEGDLVLLKPYAGLWIEPFAAIDHLPLTIDHFKSPVRAVNGQVIILVDEQESWTSLELPDNLSSTHVTTGVVLSSSGSSYGAGSRVVFSNYNPTTRRFGAEQIEPGIVSVPESFIYAQLHQSGYKAGQVRFVGGPDSWRDSVLMKWGSDGRGMWDNDQGRGWIPLDPWILIERDVREYSEIEMPAHAAAKLKYQAKVLQWHDDEYPEGTRIVLDPNPNLGFSFDLGDMSKAVQLVPESVVWGIVE